MCVCLLALLSRYSHLHLTSRITSPSHHTITPHFLLILLTLTPFVVDGCLDFRSFSLSLSFSLAHTNVWDNVWSNEHCVWARTSTQPIYDLALAHEITYDRQHYNAKREKMFVTSSLILLEAHRLLFSNPLLKDDTSPYLTVSSVSLAGIQSPQIVCGYQNTFIHSVSEREGEREDSYSWHASAKKPAPKICILIRLSVFLSLFFALSRKTRPP